MTKSHRTPGLLVSANGNDHARSSSRPIRICTTAPIAQTRVLAYLLGLLYPRFHQDPEFVDELIESNQHVVRGTAAMEPYE